MLQISGKPRRVYSGDWEEYETMAIRWMDGHSLFINGTVYLID
ncbi:hypothetical protein AALB16_00355 [Lachnospiraceae bacterium 62-35]